MSVKQATYSKLDAGILEGLKAHRILQALITVPVTMYRELVANAKAITKEWPGIVWRSIASTLEKAQVGLVDSQELNAVVDNHVWNIRQHPFTLSYIDSNRFREIVHRKALSYGLNALPTSFDYELSLIAAAGQADLINTARHEREAISIAIADYILSHHQSISSPPFSPCDPNVVMREARKLKTQGLHDSWKKKYRALKKEHPDKSDSWCSQKIAKMSIADGRNAETIRKQMKK